MSRAPDPEQVANQLAEQRDEAPAELQHFFLTFEELYERKLWHQLTDALLEFFANRDSRSQQLQLYNTFISSFADKINQLKLVKLALSASRQQNGTHGSACRRTHTDYPR
jgi:26S proteasome regulatory subunit N9